MVSGASLKSQEDNSARIQGVKMHRIPNPDPQHWFEYNTGTGTA
jgi:hypothetical protein